MSTATIPSWRRIRTVCAVAPAALAAALLAGCGGGSHRPPVPVDPGPAAVASGAGHRFYEVYDPVPPVRGTMLVIHGGGWGDAPGDARKTMAPISLTLRQEGWRVVDIAYTPGLKTRERDIDPRPMLRDVEAFYDQARRAFGGPVCAYGESAGGHLAALLAVRRPSLSCAVLAAPPLALAGVAKDSTEAGKSVVRMTFGTDPAVLRAWSPASIWNPAVNRTPVFLTSGSNDAVVTPAQLKAFVAADPAVDAAVVPGADAGSADSVTWMHSVVRKSTLDVRLAALDRWFDRIVPRPKATRPTAPPASAGTGCDRRPGGSIVAGGARLMLSGDAWQQASTGGQPIGATRGCSGSARRQDDGLSLWALPYASVLPPAAEATLTLTSRRPVRQLVAAFRGFLARPQDWTLGLYAAGAGAAAPEAPVAACDRGTCTGLRRFEVKDGALIAAAGSQGDPDARSSPAPATFTLPPGTRRLTWRLRCVNADGCRLGVSPAARPRDPAGHPAIFSLYRAELRR